MDLPADIDDGSEGTDQLLAWHAYARGHAARTRWALADAEREFRDAVRIDPRFAQAQPWLAQVLAWTRPYAEAEWRDIAGVAVAARNRLAPEDTLHARALVMLASRRYSEAGALFRTLSRARPESDFP